MRTLLSDGVVVTCDQNWTVYTHGDLVLDDDLILYAGPNFDGEYDARVSAAGRLVMPGLINAHAHTPMTLFRGLADDVPLRVFLQERVWPREIQLTTADAYAGSVLGATEMLKAGVTTCVDMYFFEDALVQAALDTGIRAVVGPGILEAPVWQPILGTWEQRTARVLDFCTQWDGHDGRIHTGLGPHAPYTLPLPALGEIAVEAQRAGLPLHIHLVETREEREAFAERGLGSTVSALERLGVFDGAVLAAHCVWLDDGDAEILRHHRVGVAHCPVSNAKLGAGIAPVATLLAAGIPVGLGTDGAATNNSLDLWEELKLAPLLAKVAASDPTVLSARQALAMATRMAAMAIHQPHLGVLAEGYKADILTLRLDDPAMVPLFGEQTYMDHLVYAAGRSLVDAVWVNGRQVVRDGMVLTVDEAAVRHAAQRAAQAVSKRVAC